MPNRQADWDPRADFVLRDQEAAYDHMRKRCPVAYSEFAGWSLFKHEDVVRVLMDHETFSNVASAHRSVPNGMDPPEHTAYRRAIEPHFAAERMAAFAPTCRSIARALVDQIPPNRAFDFVESFALPFAVECQCVFLGWPRELMTPICDWTRQSQVATLAGDREALSALASEFRERIGSLLSARRRASESEHDVTAALLRTRVNGALLTDEELTSILRNWTVGEVGSMSAALAIVVRQLALQPSLQDRLRSDGALIPAAVEESLRVSGPLVANRRVATRDVEIGGRTINAGERLSVMWVAANRDESVFARASEISLERDQSQNLLYGAGIHVCPGAPLARLELTVALEEVLGRHLRFAIPGAGEPRRAVYPANGWVNLPITFTAA